MFYIKCVIDGQEWFMRITSGVEDIVTGEREMFTEWINQFKPHKMTGFVSALEAKNVSDSMKRKSVVINQAGEAILGFNVKKRLWNGLTKGLSV